MTHRLITALAVGLGLRVLPCKDRVTGLEHEGESMPVSEQKGGDNRYIVPLMYMEYGFGYVTKDPHIPHILAT